MVMKLFGKKFALVLALIAVFAMTGSALAAEIIVSNTTDGEQDKAYTTVADAVENAADDATITIPAGEYPVHNVTITDKSLTIRGAEDGGTIFTDTITNTAGTDQMLKLYGNVAGTVIENIEFQLKTSNDAYDAAMIYIGGTGSAENPVTIQNCSFTGSVDEGGTNQAVAILTPGGGNSAHVKVTNNTITNVKYSMYFNSINNAEISGNAISDTRYSAINLTPDSSAASYDWNGVKIEDNTLTNIATQTDYSEPSYASGISANVENNDVAVTGNQIDMAEGEGRQNLATNGITQVAQVTVTDADGKESNVYFATLADAVASDRTPDGSKITLLSEPTEDDAKTVIDKNVTIDATNAPKYTPVGANGGEVIKNDDGTFTVKAPAAQTTPAAPAHSGGGGGCSAGFGALALLAAMPLMFRRKK